MLGSHREIVMTGVSYSHHVTDAPPIVVDCSRWSERAPARRVQRGGYTALQFKEVRRKQPAPRTGAATEGAAAGN